MYEKKVKVDKDIIDLVGQMNNILSFVEHTEGLKAKMENSAKCIQSVLQTIEDCSKKIRVCLGARTASKNKSEPDLFHAY